MGKIDIEPEQIVFIFMLGIVIVITAACLALRVYVFKEYGNTPIAEVPAWAYWVMQDDGD